MKKSEYLENLKRHLEANNVSDIEEIIGEYEEHFAFKIADGYSEEEIAAKLSKPEVLAKQYEPNASLDKMDFKKATGKAITITGLLFADIFAGTFFITFFAWIIVLGMLTVTCAAIGICLIGGLNIYSLIPPMPYWCAVIYAAAVFAFTVLTSVAVIYCAVFMRQLMRAYGRFHRNCIAAASGKAVLPSLATHPQFEGRTHRRLRNVVLFSLAAFSACFITGFVVSAISAGSPEFWHVWNWFV